MIPPIMRRQSARPIGAEGLAAEKRIAKRVEGRQMPGSGAMQGAKGDVTLPDVLLEVKSTVNDSLSLKLEWLAKITGEARAVGKEPALSVLFTTGDGRPRKDGAWVMVTERYFNELQELKGGGNE